MDLLQYQIYIVFRVLSKYQNYNVQCNSAKFSIEE